MEIERTLKLGKRPLYSLIAVIDGTIVGWVLGPSVSAIKPFGDV